MTNVTTNPPLIPQKGGNAKNHVEKQVSKTKHLEKEAIEAVRVTNPHGTGHHIVNAYSNIMDGTLIEVQFTTAEGVAAINHVLLRRGAHEVYRTFHEACLALASHKERSFFFRLLNAIGVGGLIALILIIVFSILLCFLALTNGTPNQSIIEVIKLSFAIILGYFFGSQKGRDNE